MTARYIVFFIWGLALASAWWAAGFMGYGDLSPLWALAILLTFVTVIIWGFVLMDDWG